MAKKVAVDKTKFQNPEGVTQEIVDFARTWRDLMQEIKHDEEMLAAKLAKKTEMDAYMEATLARLEGQTMKIDNLIIRLEEKTRTLGAKPNYAALLDLKGVMGFINQRLPEHVAEAKAFLEKATREAGSRWDPEEVTARTIKVEAEIWGKAKQWISAFADSVYSWIRSGNEWIDKATEMIDAIAVGPSNENAAMPSPLMKLDEQQAKINAAKEITIMGLDKKITEVQKRLALGSMDSFEGLKQMHVLADLKEKVRQGVVNG